MTGNEAELIERLIVQAVLRGRTELQLERAVLAGEEATSSLAGQRMLADSYKRERDEIEERTARAIAELRTVVHESRNREQACLLVLGEVSDAIGRFAKAGRNKQKPFDALLAAKAKADKLQDPIPF
jgi:hypothetical protein